MTQHDATPRSTTAVGFTVFAGVLMMTAGLVQALTGLIALFNDEFFVVGEEYIFQFDISTWGWIHLILGIVVALAGVFVFSGAVWARTIGVILAVLSAVANFLWLPWYPVWGIIMIALAVFVIWALTVHGRDIVE
ncbi:hypothetical protein [Demequina sp. NBRC 110053]|uniref:DUF7144 family membrane protein n=1 Tax=Demequina sp. NBRC 110053 TaxID=1570342 RepID=UPI0009FFA156|nr:hypothetical protein [Demequina sp. NBRC 110053]